MSRLEAATESIMAHIRTVVTRSSRPSPLPAWTATFTKILELLHGRQLFDALAVQCAIARQGGYSGLDLLVVGLAYFLAQDPKGLKGFSASMMDGGKRVAACAGLKRLPTAASISRLLCAADRLEEADEFVSWLLAQGSACRDLLRNPLVLARDALGVAWSIYDFDPSVVARRLRALAQGADLPEAVRRSKGLCAPGYTGRKRAETQYSLAILSHSGAGLWMHVSAWSGNTPFAQAIGMAAKSVARAVSWACLSLDTTLLRFDGAGGNFPAIAAVAAHGIHYLTRLGSCSVLEQPGVLEFLAKADWQVVRDSGSGPRRQATELGSWALSNDEFLKETEDDRALRSRLVVSRFPAAKDGKRHGSGVEMGDWHYEVLATDLSATAWSAPESVTLYYGRCGQENSFAQSAAEFELGKTHSKTLAGQRLMAAIGMWVANLKRVMAVQHQGDLGPAPDQQPRTAELVTRLLADAPSVQTGASDAEAGQVSQAEAANAPSGGGEPTAQVAVEQGVQGVQVATAPSRLTPQVLAQVPRTLTCKAGALIPLRNIRLVNGTYTYASYRSLAGVCGQCVQFKGCTYGVYPSYRREFGVRIPGWVLEFRADILQHYKRLREHESVQPAPVPPAPAQPVHPAPAALSPVPTPPPPVVAPPLVRTASAPKRQAPPKPQGPRLILPTAPPPPGPWVPAPPSLFMPVLLANWQAHLARHRIEVEVREPVKARARLWVRHTDAERQCRRQTWAHRRLYNTSNAKVNIIITEYSA